MITSIVSILMFGLNIFVRLLTFLLIFDSVWCNIKMSRIFIIYIFSAEIIMLMLYAYLIVTEL